MEKSSVQQKILPLTLKKKYALYAAYMPFVKNGGLFIPTDRVYQMGEEVFILLNLMEETKQLPIAGKVIWITPSDAQGYRATGIGVQFNDQGTDIARSKIELYLAGLLESERLTHTM